MVVVDAAVTLRVTAMATGVLEAPDASTVTKPVYVVPAVKPGVLIFIDTDVLPGVVPLAGFTDSHEPPLSDDGVTV
jgi:hypothetical protein